MLIELLLAGIIVNQGINSVDKEIKDRIKNCKNELDILQKKVDNDLLLYENQKLKKELEELKNKKE